MDKAERLIDSIPDSSLNSLSSIPRTDLRGDQERSRHALLTVMAKDKCYLPLYKDSDFLRAVDYYRQSGPDSLLLRAFYYLGRIHFELQEYPSALLSYFQSKEIADKNKDYFWSGMAARGISDIYNETYNASEELKYAREELDNFQKSGRQPYINYAMLDLARSLGSNNKINDAIDTLNIICDSAKVHKDPYLSHHVRIYLAINYIKNHQPTMAQNKIKEITAFDKLDENDSVYLAIAFGEAGMNDEVFKISQTLKNNDPKLLLPSYKYLKQEGNYQNAIEKLEELYAYSDSLLLTRTGIGVSDPLINYLDSKRIQAEKKQQQTKTHVILVSLFILLSLIAITIFITIRHKRKLKEKIVLADQLMEDLNRSRSLTEKNEFYLKKLLQTKYTLFEEIARITTEANTTSSKGRKIDEKLAHAIDRLSLNNQNLTELETEINASYNNLLSDFKKTFPELKEIDFRLYIFSILGFSSPVIALLLNEKKVTSIYNRKRRLKDKIKSLPEKDCERFMHPLN